MTLKEAIRAIVGQELKATIKVGTVLSFDKQNSTVDVDLITESEITDVRIRAAIDGAATGLIIEPKIGSIVLIGLIENRDTSAFVLGYTEIEKYIINTNQGIELNGDNLGGLVIADKVSAEIAEIKKDLTLLKSLFGGWVPVPTDGGASLKATLAAYVAQPLVTKPKTFYESTKTRHGN